MVFPAKATDIPFEDEEEYEPRSVLQVRLPRPVMRRVADIGERAGMAKSDVARQAILLGIGAAERLLTCEDPETVIEFHNTMEPTGTVMLAGSHIIAVHKVDETTTRIYMTGYPEPVLVHERYADVIARLIEGMPPGTGLKPNPV